MRKQSKKIMLVTGEVSGDRRGGELAQALLRCDPKLSLFGIGGDAMRAAGVDTLIDIRMLSVFGVFELIRHVPRILRVLGAVERIIKARRPDLVILIDNYGFNIRVARCAKRYGCKTLYYVGPQVWATRPGRVKKMAQYIDRLAVIFDFEPACYTGEKLAVDYVGHPLARIADSVPDTAQVRRYYNIRDGQKAVVLMPGSRSGEVERLLPIMLAAAEKLTAAYPDMLFLLPVVPAMRDQVRARLADSELNIMTTEDDALMTINAADVGIIASGTAVLETALLQKPMVITAKVHPLTAMLIRKLINVPYVGLCNIIAGKVVAQEYLQEEATADNIAAESLKILRDDDYRRRMIAELARIKDRLGQGNAAQNVADIALAMTHQRIEDSADD